MAWAPVNVSIDAEFGDLLVPNPQEAPAGLPLVTDGAGKYELADDPLVPIRIVTSAAYAALDPPDEGVLYVVVG